MSICLQRIKGVRKSGGEGSPILNYVENQMDKIYKMKFQF